MIEIFFPSAWDIGDETFWDWLACRPWFHIDSIALRWREQIVAKVRVL